MIKHENVISAYDMPQLLSCFLRLLLYACNSEKQILKVFKYITTNLIFPQFQTIREENRTCVVYNGNI